MGLACPLCTLMLGSCDSRFPIPDSQQIHLKPSPALRLRHPGVLLRRTKARTHLA